MLLSKASNPQSAHEFCISYTGILTQLEALEISSYPLKKKQDSHLSLHKKGWLSQIAKVIQKVRLPSVYKRKSFICQVIWRFKHPKRKNTKVMKVHFYMYEIMFLS